MNELNDLFPNITLASASPRRYKLLQQIGLKFIVSPSQIQEPELDGKNIEDIENGVQELALKKADYVAQKQGTGLIIGSDTTVVYQSKSLGKPKGRFEAKRVLKMLSNGQHRVLTGIALIDINRNKRKVWCEGTNVFFRSLTDTEIEDYVSSGEADDKAGSYGIQGKAAIFVERIDGCYFNVMGLPLASLVQEMRILGSSSM